MVRWPRHYLQHWSRRAEAADWVGRIVITVDVVARAHRQQEFSFGQSLGEPVAVWRNIARHEGSETLPACQVVHDVVVRGELCVQALRAWRSFKGIPSGRIASSTIAGGQKLRKRMTPAATAGAIDQVASHANHVMVFALEIQLISRDRRNRKPLLNL